MDASKSVCITEKELVSMERIIDPVAPEAIIAELTEEKFLRHSTKATNQLYIVNYHNSPNILREIGRLREEAFRSAGGGTGKEADIDQYDIAEKPYDQLIVWDPEEREITAGYRLLDCNTAPRDAEGRVISATAKLFDLSNRFTGVFLPQTAELGRSFVQPKYQKGASRKGLFALDNLWDGLAAYMIERPHLKYMFGKVTMYPHYDRMARNMILAFLAARFPDPDQLLRPHEPIVSAAELQPYQAEFAALDYKEAYRKLNAAVKARGENIPPLINSYMGLSQTMRTFGTAENKAFGKVEETGILITYQDISEERKQRYLDTFAANKEFTGPLVKRSS